MRQICDTSSAIFIRIMGSLLVALAACLWGPAANAAVPQRIATLQGTVQSGRQGLARYQIYLYASFIDHGPSWILLGRGVSDNSGHFQLHYLVNPRLWQDDQPVLFVEAVKGQSMLASCIGIGSAAPDNVVVNERTTVATANAYAQFVGSTQINGNYYGMKNASAMTTNFADPGSGSAGMVISTTPNGGETSTFETFNSLSNVVASCVADGANCDRLIRATTPAGGPAPANVLQALSNLVKYPSYPGYPRDAEDPIFQLSLLDPVYQPALEHRPTSWLLFLKLTGGFYSQQDSNNLMNGPGNFAIDEQGFVWINDNYVPQPPGHFACAGLRAIKLDPSGKPVTGTPFFGGGLSGAGWGITIDLDGNVWIGNFGFQDPPCQFLPQKAPHNSVTKMLPDGTPVSGPDGFTDGNMSWPMGTVADRMGNMWMANCGNDTVTRYEGGNHTLASNIPLGPHPPPNNPLMKPFGVATDLDDNVWVTNNGTSSVSVLSPQGTLLKTIGRTYQGRTILTHPVGNAADIEGNMWVANSDYLDVPCPKRARQGTAENPSITMFQMSTREPYPGSPFTGGGLTLPWGIAVDGDDTVWVFNFGADPVGQNMGNVTAISRFCGVNTRRCPAGMDVGDPISPPTGYQSNALMRITGGQIDPSGNIWLADNWKIDANPFHNPGGNAVVVAVGAAGPLKTPLIGPPVPFR